MILIQPLSQLIDKKHESQKREVMGPRSHIWWHNRIQTHHGLSRSPSGSRGRGFQSPEDQEEGEESSRGGGQGVCQGGSSCLRLSPLQTLSPADYLYNQSFLPNGIVSAPTGEVQGSLAMKHAVLHFPNIFCFGREDVFGFPLHPVRTKGSH